MYVCCVYVVFRVMCVVCSLCDMCRMVCMCVVYMYGVRRVCGVCVRTCRVCVCAVCVRVRACRRRGCGEIRSRIKGEVGEIRTSFHVCGFFPKGTPLPRFFQ